MFAARVLVFLGGAREGETGRVFYLTRFRDLL